MNNNLNNYRLYGRSKGRKRIKISNNEYVKYIEKYKIDYLKKNENYILDIGSGDGENTVFLSEKFKESKIIACDKFKDGNINLCEQIKLKKLNNIYIFPGNVHELLDNNKDIKYFSSVWILFPDPWPKKRHQKRRLINEEFFHKIEKYMKKNCYLLISTDSTSYLKEILFLVYKIRSSFCWENQNIYGLEYQNNLIPQTKYYKKALKSGRNSFFIKLRKL